MNQEEKIAKAEAILNAAKEFGDTPKYSFKNWNGSIYVCLNNGQFHHGEAERIPGYATFIGLYSASHIVENYQGFLKVHEAEALGLRYQF